MEARHVTTEWGGGVKDVDWIPLAAANGWTLITVDRLNKTKEERFVLSESGMVVIFASPQVLNCRDAIGQVGFFATYYETIRDAAAAAQLGETFRLSLRGRVEKINP